MQKMWRRVTKNGNYGWITYEIMECVGDPSEFADKKWATECADGSYIVIMATHTWNKPWNEPNLLSEYENSGVEMISID